MHARVTRFEIDDGKEKELTAGYRGAIDILKTQRGFQEAILMIDSETRQAVSVTLWDTKENLAATGKTGPGSIIDKMLSLVRPFQKAAPTYSSFEVKLRIR
jgi:hypothetical protein